MQDYLTSKAISLLIPLMLIGAGSLALFVTPADHWRVLIYAAMLFGYMHALIGFVYQIRALRQSPNTGRSLGVLAALTALSVALCAALLMNGHGGAFMLFVIMYFVVHGFLNERTILRVQAGHTLPYLYVIGLAVFSIGLFYASLVHSSFFFDGSLTFYTLSEEMRQFSIERYVGVDPKVIAFGLLSIGILLVALSVPAMRTFRKTLTGTGFFLLSLLAVFVVFYPLNYIYLFHLFLTYHFIVWSIVFYQKYRTSAPERVPSYVRHHAYVLGGATLLLMLFVSTESGLLHSIGSFVFDARTFLTVSFVHITVSFMNEGWFKRMLG